MGSAHKCCRHEPLLLLLTCSQGPVASVISRVLFRGAHENYVDRQAAALVRLYSADISTLHTPYVAPSENGGRGGVRWLALAPPQTGSEHPLRGCPVIVAAAQPVASTHACQAWPDEESDAAKASGERPAFCPRDGIHFSASYHSTEALHAAKHEHELPQGRPCILHLDGMHMGVGGDDSWTPSVRSTSHSHNLHSRRYPLLPFWCLKAGFPHVLSFRV